jgi:hypothetical protein
LLWKQEREGGVLELVGHGTCGRCRMSQGLGKGFENMGVAGKWRIACRIARFRKKRSRDR